MRQGYLPLLAPDVTPERLERCGLFDLDRAGTGVFVGRMRRREAVRPRRRDFPVHGRRRRVAADRSAVGRVRLSRFPTRRFRRAKTHMSRNRSAGASLGGRRMTIAKVRSMRLGRSSRSARVAPAKRSSIGQEAKTSATWLPAGKSDGLVVVIGDTHFGGNENFRTNANAAIRFWRWLLSRTTPGQKPWNPPAGVNTNASDPSEDDDTEEPRNDRICWHGNHRMIRFWIGTALLAGSWLLGLDYFYPANPYAWLAAVAAGVVLLGNASKPLAASQLRAAAIVLFLPAVWFASWPYRAAPLLIVLGLAIPLLPIESDGPTGWPAAPWWRASCCLVQALVLELYAAHTAYRTSCLGRCPTCWPASPRCWESTPPPTARPS